VPFIAINNMDSNKKIIIFTLIFVFLSFVFLAYSERMQANPAYQNNWWALYFENPKDKGFNFTIENYTNNKNFHWEISNNSGKIDAGDISLDKGTKQSINLDDINASGKITVSVKNGTDKKEIYKILN